MSDVRPAPRTWDFLLTLVLVFLQAVLVVVFVLSAVGISVANTGCATQELSCDPTRVQVGQIILLWVPPVIALVTAVWAIVRVLRRRVGFWVALLGIALMVLVFLGGRVVMDGIVL